MAIRWSRSCWTSSAVFLFIQISIILIILIQREKSPPDDGDVTRVNRRRLARGEPSGGENSELSHVEEEESVIIRLEIYRQRKQRVRKTMEDTFPWPPEKSLMLQPSWHLLYCWIHKVASTSWSEVFFYLRGKRFPLADYMRPHNTSP